MGPVSVASRSGHEHCEHGPSDPLWSPLETGHSCQSLFVTQLN